MLKLLYLWHNPRKLDPVHMKEFFTVVSLILSSSIVWGQDSVLAFLKVTYDYIQETGTQTRRDTMLLEVGQSGSYFFDASAERKTESDIKLNGRITRL